MSGCGSCAERAAKAFAAAGYVKTGEWWVREDDRVHEDDLARDHGKLTLARPNVAVEATKEIGRALASSLLDKLRGVRK